MRKEMFKNKLFYGVTELRKKEALRNEHVRVDDQPYILTSGCGMAFALQEDEYEFPKLEPTEYIILNPNMRILEVSRYYNIPEKYQLKENGYSGLDFMKLAEDYDVIIYESTKNVMGSHYFQSLFKPGFDKLKSYRTDRRYYTAYLALFLTDQIPTCTKFLKMSQEEVYAPMLHKLAYNFQGIVSGNDYLTAYNMDQAIEQGYLEDFNTFLQLIVRKTPNWHEFFSVYLTSAWFLSDSQIGWIMEYALQYSRPKERYSDIINLETEWYDDYCSLDCVEEGYEILVLRLINTYVTRTYKHMMKLSDKKKLSLIHKGEMLSLYNRIREVLEVMIIDRETVFDNKYDEGRRIEAEVLLDDILKSGVSATVFYNNAAFTNKQIDNLQLYDLYRVGEFLSYIEEAFPEEYDIIKAREEDTARQAFYDKYPYLVDINQMLMRKEPVIRILERYPELVKNEKLDRKLQGVANMPEEMKVRLDTFYKTYKCAFRRTPPERFLVTPWRYDNQVVTFTAKQAGIRYVLDNNLPECAFLFKEATILRMKGGRIYDHDFISIC